MVAINTSYGTVDDLNVPGGNIVGGDTKIGTVHYHGRQQGGQVFGSDDDDIIERLKFQRDTLIGETGAAKEYIYPDDEAWEIRIRP